MTICQEKFNISGQKMVVSFSGQIIGKYRLIQITFTNTNTIVILISNLTDTDNTPIQIIIWNVCHL